MSIKDLLDEAAKKLEPGYIPDVQDALKKISEIAVAMGQYHIRDVVLERIRRDSVKTYISYRFKNITAQLQHFTIPNEVIDADDPVREAKLYIARCKVKEAEANLKNWEDVIERGKKILETARENLKKLEENL